MFVEYNALIIEYNAALRLKTNTPEANSYYSIGKRKLNIFFVGIRIECNELDPKNAEIILYKKRSKVFFFNLKISYMS